MLAFDTRICFVVPTLHSSLHRTIRIPLSYVSDAHLSADRYWVIKHARTSSSTSFCPHTSDVNVLVSRRIVCIPGYHDVNVRQRERGIHHDSIGDVSRVSTYK